MNDLPLTAIVAAGAAILGALIPTVTNIILAERNRRSQVVEKWNEKFWERRFIAYQDFFVALQELGYRATFMAIDARENGGRLTPALHDKHTKLIDEQLLAIGVASARGLLLFERGFQTLVNDRFTQLANEAPILEPSDPGHTESIVRATKVYERLIDELESIARDHLNPRYLAGFKSAARH